MDELTNLQIEQLVPFLKYTYDPVEDYLENLNWNIHLRCIFLSSLN